jgi:hypothetical protein
MGDSLERPSGREMAIGAIGQAFATFLGLAVGGPDGAILGSALGPYGIRLIQLSAAEWGRKSQILAETALDVSGIENPEEFFDILSESPALSALAQRILWAASMSGNDSKLRALGSLLGGAVARRGDRLDETEMLSTVLADIEKAHVVTLEILADEPPDAGDQRQKAQEAGHADFEPAWLVSQVQAELPMTPELALPCLRALVRHGLADTVGTYGGGTRYRITDFGRDLLRVMAQSAE